MSAALSAPHLCLAAAAPLFSKNTNWHLVSEHKSESIYTVLISPLENN